MLHTVFVLSFIGLQHFVVIVEPGALASPIHLTAAPAAFIFVVDADQSSEALYYIVFKVSLVNGTVDVLYSSFSVAKIGVKLSIV